VGGNILATKKTSYADIVNADNLTVVVRELMEEQHKAMLRNLVNGVYDGLDIPGKPPAAEPAAAAQPQVKPKPAAPDGVSQPPSPLEGKPPEEPRPPAPPPKPAPEKFPKPAEPPRTVQAMPAHAAPTQPEMPAAGQHVYKPPPPEKIPTPAKPAQPAPKVTIRPPAAKPAPAARAPAPAAQDKASEELPPEVEAARRMSDRPKPKDTTGPTIFGEDLISEKSLDEVILGYLAGDGEEGS
jgi:hypothetical protein